MNKEKFELMVAELRKMKANYDQDLFPGWLADYFLPKLRREYPKFTDADEERLMKEITQ